MPTQAKDIAEYKLRADIKTICHLLYSKGLISGFDGNCSLKISDELILITPANSHRGLLTEDDFVLVNLKDESTYSSNGKEPTYDLYIHLAIYKKRTDIGAIIHAHPTAAVSLTISNIDINEPILPPSIIELGEVGITAYKGINEKDLLDQTVNLLAKHDVIMWDKHGSITVGKDIYSAFQKLETLEYTAKVLFNSHLIGETKTLSEDEIKELINERHKTYGKELADREGKDLFQDFTQKLTVKKLISKVLESESPVFQRILSLTHELTVNTIEKTCYCSKMTREEKEQLARELTGSFFRMILGKFTKKTSL